MTYSLSNSNPLYSFPDHPDIASALRTGYPRNEQPYEVSVYCGYCEECLDDKKRYRDEEYEYLCQKCLCELHERE